MTERKTLEHKAKRLILNENFNSLIGEARQKAKEDKVRVTAGSVYVLGIRREMEEFGFILPPIWNELIRDYIQNPEFPFVAVASRISAGSIKLDGENRSLEVWEDTGVRTARAMAEKLIKIDKEKNAESLGKIKKSGVNLKEHPWSDEKERLGELIRHLHIEKKMTFEEIENKLNPDNLENFDNYLGSEKIKSIYYQYLRRTGNK